MIFSGMTSSNTAEYKFYLNSGVIKFQFIIIICILYKKNNDSTNYKFHATTQSSVLVYIQNSITDIILSKSSLPKQLTWLE